MIDNIIAADTMLATLTRLLHQEWLTPVDALEKARCFSLSQRCGNLRKMGYNVIDKWVKLPSGKRVKAYTIIPRQPESDRIGKYRGFDPEGCYFVEQGQRDRLAMEKL